MTEQKTRTSPQTNKQPANERGTDVYSSVGLRLQVKGERDDVSERGLHWIFFSHNQLKCVNYFRCIIWNSLSPLPRSQSAETSPLLSMGGICVLVPIRPANPGHCSTVSALEKMPICVSRSRCSTFLSSGLCNMCIIYSKGVSDQT